MKLRARAATRYTIMDYYDAREEILERDRLSRLQREKLARSWNEILADNAFYRGKFSSIAFDPLVDPIERLPLTTRAELQRDQADHPPYGRILTYPLSRYTRVHQTSGSGGRPLRWLDTASSWEWFKRCWLAIYHAAGVCPEDRLAFTFSFGPFIGFWAAFEAAASLGSSPEGGYWCLPAGGMTTQARLQYMLDHHATVVCCTPTYALRLTEVARHEEIDTKSMGVRAFIVAGEPGGSIPATRARIEQAWNARVFDHAGMTEMGAWGFECQEAPGGLHVNEAEFIAEVIDPESGALLPEGRSGELVLTNLGRWGSPLIRYRTGDQVRLTHDRCPCGRGFARAEGGILGRVDDMMVIRGNNIFPSAIEGILREFEEVVEFRIHRVERDARVDLELDIEPAPGVKEEALIDRITQRFRDRFHFKPHVKTLAPGSLPRFEMKARRLARGESEV